MSIHIKNSTFDHGSVVAEKIGKIVTGSIDSAKPDDAILKELQELQQKLKETDRGIARMVGDLREAVKKQDESKKKEMIQDLTTGTIGAVIAELASSTLKKFLGLPG